MFVFEVDVDSDLNFTSTPVSLSLSLSLSSLGEGAMSSLFSTCRKIYDSTPKSTSGQSINISEWKIVERERGREREVLFVTFRRKLNENKHSYRKKTCRGVKSSQKLDCVCECVCVCVRERERKRERERESDFRWWSVRCRTG